MDFLNNTKWYHIIIVLFVLGLIYLICRENSTSSNAQSAEGFADQDKKPQLPKYEIILYYAMWCGHSKTFLPEWEKFESYVKKSLPHVRADKVRCEDGNEATCMQKGVQGYPTVILYLEDGSEKQFEGQRTYDGLMQFLQKNI